MSPKIIRMLLRPLCLEPNCFAPPSFIANSHIFPTLFLRPCLRSFSVSQSFNIYHSIAPILFSEETCLNLLSHCKSTSPKLGTCIHPCIVKLGFEAHHIICNNLLHLYSKQGQPDNTLKLFDEMPHRDIVSWTTSISALVQNDRFEGALHLYDDMRLAGFVPNHFTLSMILRCAMAVGDLDLGTSHHALIFKHGFNSNLILMSGLLNFYSKFGMSDEAFQIFELMNDRDTILWTTIISASVEAKDWKKTTCLYIAMLRDGVFPNEFTFTKLLTACSNLKPRLGELVHAHVILLGIELNVQVKTAIVDMYSKCDNMITAIKVLHSTSGSDVKLCTAIISGYVRAGEWSKAVSFFQDMRISLAFSPNSFTYATVLNASALFSLPELGKGFHCLVLKAGLQNDVSVGNAVVDFYSRCSPQLEDLVNAFAEIVCPNIVSWTALISGLVCHGEDRAAMAVLGEMQADGVKPSSFTLSAILTDLSSEDSAANAQKLHAMVLKTNLESRDITVGNSLIYAYTKLGRPTDAGKVFDEMPNRDVCTYTSVAKGLNQAGLHRQVLSLFGPMRAELTSIDGFSLSSFLAAASALAAVKCGRQLHCYSLKTGLSSSISVMNGLMDMYGKCGSIAEARSVFALTPDPNIVSWNGFISILASSGHFVEALSTFEEMRMKGVVPDSITLLIALNACSHGGLVDLGMDYFNSMEERFGLVPQEDHYICLIDMLGRAGRLEAAAEAIEAVAPWARALAYKTLLGCCKLHGNVAMGEWAASRAMDLDPFDSAIYVLLAGLYDDAGMVVFGEETRRTMRVRGAIRSPGRSWL